jgi:hypothetical protein
MTNVDHIEALKEALAEAERLATEYGIEMYSEAQRAQYASERRSVQVSED